MKQAKDAASQSESNSTPSAPLDAPMVIENASAAEPTRERKPPRGSAVSGDSAASAKEVKALIQKVAREKQKFDQHDGSQVLRILSMGADLLKLRQLVKKDWTKQVAATGVNPRVATRYINIAKKWHPETGLNESDLLKRLPTDPMKLESLCRLSIPQIKEVAGKLDLKTCPRGKIVTEVKRTLGEIGPEKDDEMSVWTAVKRFMQGSMYVWGFIEQPKKHKELRKHLIKESEENHQRFLEMLEFIMAAIKKDVPESEIEAVGHVGQDESPSSEKPKRGGQTPASKRSAADTAAKPNDHRRVDESRSTSNGHRRGTNATPLVTSN
jgi:hypothetical protein